LFFISYVLARTSAAHYLNITTISYTDSNAPLNRNDRCSDEDCGDLWGARARLFVRRRWRWCVCVLGIPPPPHASAVVPTRTVRRRPRRKRRNTLLRPHVTAGTLRPRARESNSCAWAPAADIAPPRPSPEKPRQRHSATVTAGTLRPLALRPFHLALLLVTGLPAIGPPPSMTTRIRAVYAYGYFCGEDVVVKYIGWSPASERRDAVPPSLGKLYGKS